LQISGEVNWHTRLQVEGTDLFFSWWANSNSFPTHWSKFVRCVPFRCQSSPWIESEPSIWELNQKIRPIRLNVRCRWVVLTKTNVLWPNARLA